MSQFVLPKSVNYDEVLPTLPPNVQNFTQVVYPSNGSIFGPSSTINIDIPSRGCIDPQSIYIRYKMNLTNGATLLTGAPTVPGCPLYTPIQQVNTYINSQMVDGVMDYNVVAHMWTNTALSVSDKYGMMAGFGYGDSVQATDPGTMSILDGRTLSVLTANATTNSYFVSGPLVCTKLTACEKMLPAFATGGIRIAFVLDTLANWTTTPSTAFAAINISNFELVYDLVDFGSEFEQEILSKPSIMIKSSGYNNSSVNIPAGTGAGNATYVFNQRFASIRSALALPSGTALGGTQVNGKFDSVDVTTNGYYSLNVGGVSFPQGGPINLGINRSGALSELRKAIGTLYDWSKSMSINSAEFAYTENVATTAPQPGKVYIGFDLNKINSSGNAIMNGISTQNSPINVILGNTVATVTVKQLYLILNYDCVFVIDPRTKMVNITQ